MRYLHATHSSALKKLSPEQNRGRVSSAWMSINCGAFSHLKSFRLPGSKFVLPLFRSCANFSPSLFTLIIRGRQSKELSINIWLCDVITRIHAKICHVHMLCVRLLDLVLGYVNKAASVAADWFYHHAHYTSVTQTRFYPVIG